MGTLFANSQLKAVSTPVKCESGNQVCTCMASFSETHPCMCLRLYKSYQSYMYEYFYSCFYTAFNSIDTEFWNNQGFRVGEFTEVMDRIIKNSCFFQLHVTLSRWHLTGVMTHLICGLEQACSLSLHVESPQIDSMWPFLPELCIAVIHQIKALVAKAMHEYMYV